MSQSKDLFFLFFIRLYEELHQVSCDNSQQILFAEKTTIFEEMYVEIAGSDFQKFLETILEISRI